MSTQAFVVVRSPGLLTTVQDEGRWGWQHLGVPVGGPMDALSCRRANRLAGNDPGAAALEITLVGPTLEVHGPAIIAVAGATFDARLDGEACPHDTPVRVEGRALLTMGPRRRGARAYLAVRGGFDTPVVLGSRSTSTGVPGTRPLQQGDVLPVASVSASTSRIPASGITRAGLPRVPPDDKATSETDGVVTLRVLAVESALHDDVLATLCAAPYEIGTQSNRMGYRLHGPRLTPAVHQHYSAGTVAGMLQVPADGQPILLMADRQTTGGYPVAGVVISADLPRAGQLAPGDRCAFVTCSRRDAMAALLAQQRAELDG